MLTHIIMLQLKPDTDEATTEAVAEGLRALVGQVPGLTSARIGRDLGLADGNSHVVGILEFDSEESWRGYAGHPAHRSLVETTIAPVLANRAALQASEFRPAEA